MELTIKTTNLQDLVGKAIKCVSNNKLIPLTSLMSISVKDNCLTFTTTDATNYFYAKHSEKINCEDFEVSVIADTFTKLIQKTTSETITINVSNNVLNVKGNGSYTMELPLDENGNPIKFPNKLPEFSTDNGTVKLSVINTVINANKPSLAVNMDSPILTCYYCSDKVITSDRKKICFTNIKMFDEPMAISPTLMDLLSVMGEEDILVTSTENAHIFSTSSATVYAPNVSGVETFPVNAIENLVEQNFNSKCVVDRSSVMNVIDRLSLFVEKYDKNGIYMTFTQDGIMLSSKKSSGEELISYKSSENFEPYTCCIDIEMLRSQIASQDNEDLEIHYGAKVAIKMVNKNIIQLVALLQDDRMEA